MTKAQLMKEYTKVELAGLYAALLEKESFNDIPKKAARMLDKVVIDYNLSGFITVELYTYDDKAPLRSIVYGAHGPTEAEALCNALLKMEADK